MNTIASAHINSVTVSDDLTTPGLIAQSYVMVGKTEYRVDFEIVEGIPGHPNFEHITMVGPRGAVLIVVKYIDSENYHAFRMTGSHADLKNSATGRVAKFARDGFKLTLI